MSVTLELDDRELRRRLELLAKKVGGRKTIVPALRAGARIILAEAKANCPVRTGRLKKSLGLRQKTRLDGAIVSVGTKLPYAHLVEFGTDPHRVDKKKSGQVFRKATMHPGARKKPFLRPAFDEKQEDALEKTKEKLRDAVKSVAP